MDLAWIVGLLTGTGAAIAAVAAIEDYLSRKFVKSVRAVLTELGIDKTLQLLEQNLDGYSQSLSAFRAEAVAELDRCKRADIAASTQIHGLLIRMAKVETLIRLIANPEEERSVSAILDSQEGK